MTGFRLDADGNLRATIFEQFEWLSHGFGTRSAELPTFPMATVKQIHSAKIVDAADAKEMGLAGEADALISALPGLAVGVKTADCVPILLADRVNRVVAAVHAGWRGTVQEIVALTMQRLVENYETNPINIFAAIGPAIGSCCYEVGPSVASQFARWDLKAVGSAGKVHLDLKSYNVEQLRSAGVPAGQVSISDSCTFCDLELFFSYRRNSFNPGRMMSWIAVRKQNGRATDDAPAAVDIEAD